MVKKTVTFYKENVIANRKRPDDFNQWVSNIGNISYCVGCKIARLRERMYFFSIIAFTNPYLDYCKLSSHRVTNGHYNVWMDVSKIWCRSIDTVLLFKKYFSHKSVVYMITMYNVQRLQRVFFSPVYINFYFKQVTHSTSYDCSLCHVHFLIKNN